MINSFKIKLGKPCVKETNMKKLLGCLMVVALVGCSSPQEPKEVTRVCEVSESGANISVTAVAPNETDEVTSVVIKANALYDDLGITEEDVKEYEDLMTSTMKETLLESMGVSESEGVQIVKNEFTSKGYELEVKLDVDAMKEAFGTESDADLSLKAFVEAFESVGMTCK